MMANLISSLKVLTITVILCVTLYRFRIRLPRDIFLDPQYYYIVCYYLLIVLNLAACCILYLKYTNYTININKKSRITYVLEKITLWVNNSYAHVMDYIAGLPGNFSIMFAYITHNYLKISMPILQIIAYVPRFLLLLALMYDVFLIEKFQYSYYALYLIIFTLLQKAILYCSIEINNRILDDCIHSIEVKNYNTLLADINTATLCADNYKLIETNTQFTSIEQLFKISNLVLLELEQLQAIEDKLKHTFQHSILIRVLYIIIFSYIVYNYPISLF